MRLFFVCLLSFIFCDSFSQNLFRGKVVNYESKEPVESAFIQNRNNPGQTALSDDEGLFSIIVKVNDTLDIFRIGYESLSLVYNGGKEMNINLIAKEYDLPELTITNESAQEIVRKAIFNLKSNYIRNRAMTYLWHTIQSEEYYKEEQESYALFSAKLNKFNPKRKNIPFDFRLVDLFHLTNTIDTSYWRRNINTELLPTAIDLSGGSHKVIKVDSENDSLIAIQYIQLDNMGFPIDLLINRQDSVLIFFHTKLPYDPTRFIQKIMLNMEIVNLYILEREVSIFIRKNEDSYYFYNIYFKTNLLHKYDRSDKIEDLIYERHVKFVSESQVHNSKLKKINNKSLFKLPATTTEHFWEKYEN